MEIYSNKNRFGDGELFRPTKIHGNREIIQTNKGYGYSVGSSDGDLEVSSDGVSEVSSDEGVVQKRRGERSYPGGKIT